MMKGSVFPVSDLKALRKSNSIVEDRKSVKLWKFSIYSDLQLSDKDTYNIDTFSFSLINTNAQTSVCVRALYLSADQLKKRKAEFVGDFAADCEDGVVGALRD